MAGVSFGSLAASIVQPKNFLVGASAGVYALIAAHLGELHSGKRQWLIFKRVLFSPISLLITFQGNKNILENFVLKFEF